MKQIVTTYVCINEDLLLINIVETNSYNICLYNDDSYNICLYNNDSYNICLYNNDSYNICLYNLSFSKNAKCDPNSKN